MKFISFANIWGKKIKGRVARIVWRQDGVEDCKVFWCEPVEIRNICQGENKPEIRE
jgi:hypothetical protein